VQTFVAIALVDAGQYGDALSIYRKQMEFIPYSAILHYNLGIALTRQGQRDDGIERFRTALELDPEYANAYQQLSEALVKKGKLSEAIDLMRQAVKAMLEQLLRQETNDSASNPRP